MQFSTLSEYFAAVREELFGGGHSKKSAPEGPLALPTLRGDFFTYADAPDHYWSGYYTSRPQLKLACARLHAHVRALDVLQAVAIARLIGDHNGPRKSEHMKISKSQLDKHSFLELSELTANITRNARREAALLLHHDTITGTSNDPVVEDVYMRYPNT